ncbi:sensor histidine kinase [Chitinophagaceae bacterium MMS25-I14]
MRCSSLIALLLFCYLCGQAQIRYTLEHFTNENGLPVNGIKGLEWDNDHQLLWVGTEAGIVRWDGQHFNYSGISGNRVIDMGHYNANGHPFVYAIIEGGVVYRLYQTNFIFESQQNDVLLHNVLNPVEHFPVTAIFKAVEHKQDQHIWPRRVVLLNDPGKSILLCHKTHLYRKTGSQIDTLPFSISESSTFFKSGEQVMLNDGVNLYTYRADSRNFVKDVINGLPAGLKEYTFIMNTNTPYPVVYGDGNLYMLSKQGTSLRASLIYNGLPHTADIDIIRFLGNTGCIAIGDKTNGIYLLRQTSVTPVGAVAPEANAKAPVAYGQALLPGNSIITYNGILFDNNGHVTHHNPIRADYNFHSTARAVFYDNADTVFRYDKTTKKIIALPLPDSSYWTIFTESEGHVYAVSIYGIYELFDDHIVPVYRTPVGKNDRQAILDNGAALELEKGVIAIGGKPYLLKYHIAEHKTDTFLVTKGAHIRTLTRLADCLLMGTYGEGIYVLKGNKITSLPSDKQEYLKYTHCIVPDGKGYLYISTNNGLFKVSEAAVLHAVDHAAPVYYHYLGRRDGLVTTELNGGCQDCAIRLPDGTLSFPSMNGLAWLQPDSVLSVPPLGVILADSVIADNRKFACNSPSLQQLPYRLNNIRFNINIPYWGNAENIYAWYRLRRAEEETSETTWIKFNPLQQQDFSFAALKSDKYRFEIKVLSGFAPGDVSYMSILFTIKKPWFLQWYGILLWIVLWAVLMLLLIKWRVAIINRRAKWLGQIVEERTAELNTKVIQLGDANHLKERLISVISHNIITPLKYIYETSADLGDEQQQLPPNLQLKVVSSIKTTSKELQLLAVNLLNWIKLQHDDYANLQQEEFQVGEVIQHVNDLLYPIAIDKGVQINLKSDCTRPVIQYKDALQVILYNLVLNAILYSGEGNLVITCKQKDDLVELNVIDEGPGMPEAKVLELMSASDPMKQSGDLDNRGHGFGYLIIKDLLKLIKGTLQIESRQGIGTKVTILFPG